MHKAKLDWNRMLGFEQIADVRKMAKIGAKTGETKIGAKTGLNKTRIGAKTGVNKPG